MPRARGPHGSTFQVKAALGLVTAALGAACLLWQPGYAQFYKWTDDQGRVHYSDKAPQKGAAKKLEIKIQSYSGPAVVSAVDRRHASAGMARVRMLSTTWCGYCRQARAYMNSKGIPFEELDVEKSMEGRREFSALKGRGVPIILVGSQRMDGYSQARLDAMLRAAGN